MYKLFRNTGLIFLVLITFTYSKRLVNVVKEYDDIMIELKENKLDKKPIQAIIKDKTIIPGISGRKVNIDRSYTKMREYGKYNEDLIIYDKIYPKDKLSDNMDKFIIKTQKKEISVIVKLNSNSNIDELLNNKYNINIYIDNYYIKNNKDKIKKLVNNNYIFLNNDSAYLKKVLNQEYGYCYTEEYDFNILNNCYKNNNYTIVPNIIVKDSLLKLEKEISNGSIISTNINNYKNVLIYLNKKGYEVVSLNKLLSE